MPTYEFECRFCEHGEPFQLRLPLEERDAPRECPRCTMQLHRMFSTPHIAAIGGIPNRINAEWNEGDRHTKTIPMDGRREARREYVRRGRKRSTN